MARYVGAEVVERHDPSGAALLHLRRRRRRGTASSSTWRDGAFAGVFPTHDGEACVWLIRPADDFGPVIARRGGPAGRLAGRPGGQRPRAGPDGRAGRITAPLRGYAGLPNHVRRPSGPGWALVGDAGYHRDPITGHGMTDAFRDAELLADAADAVLRGACPRASAMARYEQRAGRRPRRRPSP